MAAYLRHKGLRRVKVSERVMSSIEWLRNVFFLKDPILLHMNVRGL